jgi:hypothetical protein
MKNLPSSRPPKLAGDFDDFELEVPIELLAPARRGTLVVDVEDFLYEERGVETVLSVKDTCYINMRQINRNAYQHHPSVSQR